MYQYIKGITMLAGCIIIICAAISACSGEEVLSTHTETETAAVLPSETQTQIQTETVTEETKEQQSSDESFYDYTAKPQEIPEMSYRNLSGLDYCLSNYICHDDTLILDTTIYKREGDKYVRTSTLNNVFNVREELGMQCAQYQNWVITASKDNASFLIYDMDTEKKYCYYNVEENMEIGPFWHVYDGCIYYTEQMWQDEFCCQRLKKLSLKNGSITEFYQPVGKESDVCIIGDFRTRDDGTMVYELVNETKGCREYWIAQADENGRWNGKKIWETSEWEYTYLLDFNQYGLVLLGEWTSKYKTVVLKDNGKTELLEEILLNTDSSIIEGEYLFTNDGYFCSHLAELEKAVWDTNDVASEFLSRRLADGVSFYDYAGNLSGYYPMVDKALLEQGYYLTKLTYHEGILTGFYVQRDTEELYISQVTTADSSAQQESNSQKWENAQSQKIISDYAAATGYEFEIAAKEFEQKIQGIWQVKEFVGWDKAMKIQWTGYQGDLFLFCENAWVDDGRAWFQPVYACHTAPMSEIAQKEYFNIQWSDDRYDNRDGILTAAVCTERNKSFSHLWEGKNFLFILLDDVIVMEQNGSYWELEKVGDIVMSDAFENVPE